MRSVHLVDTFYSESGWKLSRLDPVRLTGSSVMSSLFCLLVCFMELDTLPHGLSEEALGLLELNGFG